jgi:hypothetical protein
MMVHDQTLSNWMLLHMQEWDALSQFYNASDFDSVLNAVKQNQSIAQVFEPVLSGYIVNGEHSISG